MDKRKIKILFAKGVNNDKSTTVSQGKMMAADLVLFHSPLTTSIYVLSPELSEVLVQMKCIKRLDSAIHYPAFIATVHSQDLLVDEMKSYFEIEGIIKV